MLLGFFFWTKTNHKYISHIHTNIYMSFFISLFLIALGFLPFLLVLNKAKIINLRFIKVGIQQLLSTIQKRWRLSGTVALVFTLILSPNLNLLANSSDLVIEKIKKDIDAAVINQVESITLSSSSTNSSNTQSKKESTSSVATSFTSSLSSSSVSSMNSSNVLSSNSSSNSNGNKDSPRDC